MKKLCAVLLGVILSGHAFAKPIDVKTAKAIGYSFLTRNTSAILSNGAADLNVVYTLSDNINGNNTPCFYVFNTTANGFVIISADDNVIPVLGYSTESAFVTVGMPAHVKWWFNGYKEQISYAIKNNLQADSKTTAQWQALEAPAVAHSLAKTTNVSPLLTTLVWDQTPRYNLLCPGTGTTKSVTGCVATAMAQVMKFWSWPDVGVGANSYIPDTAVSYGVQTANFGATAYSWSSMPLLLNSSTPLTKDTAVATLMFHCGVAVDMSYNTAANDGSGAYVEAVYSPVTNCAEYALKTYFKYDPALHGDSRSQYNSTAAWVAALQADLNAGRPVIYTGQGSDGGHCWVADGYTVGTTGTTIHFNWGWSGQSNGYFTVDNLAPPALGTGAGAGNFNDFQAAIFNIHPLAAAPVTPGMKLNAAISISTTVQPYLQTITIGANVLNSTGAAFTGDITAQVYDLNGDLMTTFTPFATTIANGSNSGTLTFTGTAQNAWMMVPGTYSIRIFYRSTGGSWTLADNTTTYINNATNTVSGVKGGLLLTDSLQCSQGRLLLNGQQVSMFTSLYNNSGIDFNGTIDAALYDPVTMQQVFDIQQLPATFIGAYTQSQLFFTSTNDLSLAGGTYVLVVSSLSGASTTPVSSIFYPNPILVGVPDNVGVTNVAAQNNISIYPNPATENINIDLRGTQANAINIMDVQGRIVRTVTSTGNTVVTVPTQSFAPGMYMVQVQTDKEVITRKITITK